MKLPLLVSLPHTGLRVPPEAEAYCALSPQQIREDGDQGAAEIYDIADQVAAFITTDVARAIVDLNRPEHDRSKDGVVKTHTCWDVPVYDTFPPDDVIETLLERYHRPYHRRLSEFATEGSRRQSQIAKSEEPIRSSPGETGNTLHLGVDCHTMAAKGPPVGPDPGVERPCVCLSNADRTCPQKWIETLAAAFTEAFDRPASINHPFRGGHIVRSHAAEMPWVQLELSRAAFMRSAEKRERVLRALRNWCKRTF